MAFKRTLSAALSVLGLIFFLLAACVYFFFRYYDYSAALAILFFVLSLLFSWAAVASLKFAREGGVVEILAWGIALLDSVLSIALVLMFLLGSGLFMTGI